MASARKKQDEKNLKTLRELVALPENRYCFDCNQRGPTYVNVTIGSFVCTKCSGLLRGLTPPQRVKSISMATFTTEEVELMRTRGNFYCRRTWMALYDGIIPTDGIADDQKVRDFMAEKYERRRYYMEPSAALRNGHNPPPETKPIGVTAPETKPLRINGVGRPEAKGRNEFVADFAHADIFNAANNNPKTPSGAPFAANFDNNPVFNTNMMPSQPVNVNQTQNSATKSPPEDKYAALKDLDNALKAQPTLDWNSSSNSSVYSTPPSGGSLYNSPMSQSSSVYGSPSQGQFPTFFPQEQQAPTSNPFNAASFWNSGSNQPVINGCVPSANPFRTQEAFKANNGFTQGFQTSGFAQAVNGTNAWTPNPFKVGAASNGYSNNPFL